MTPSEKVSRAIKEYLTAHDMTMTYVAERLGCSQQAVSNQLSGRKIGANVARKWADTFGFDFTFLMTGEGDLIGGKPVPEVMLNEPHSVPLLPIFAQAGHLTGWSDAVKEAECERVISPVQDVDMAVHIYGESMYPDIPNGSVVYVKRINPESFVEWGLAYILDTVNGPLLKYLTPGKDDDHVMCLSANHDPKFAPFQVPKEDILGIYRVVMCMSMK